MVIRALRSEWVKYRHTFTWPLVILGPLALALVVGLTLPLGHGPVSWPKVLQAVGTVWPALGIPFGAALLATLAAWQDARGDTWRALRVRPVPPAALYLAKLLVLTIQALISSVLFGVFALGVGLVTVERGQLVPWGTLALAVLLPALAALPVLTIQLWLATARGFALTFALAVGGFIAGALGARYAFWPVVPWTWPIRVAVSFVGLSPSAAETPSVDLATLGLALVVALVVGTASTRWFARWEVP